MISSIRSNGSWTIYLSSKGSYTITTDHPNYTKIEEALKAKDETLLESLVDIPKSIAAFSQNLIEIKDGQVYYDGEVTHNLVAKKLLDLFSEGFDIKPLVNFLDRLMKNPSFKVVQDLYKFLENENLPITDSGTFLAYKAVQSNYMDKYTGTVENRPGVEIPRFKRNQVDDNPQHHCSHGYHAGSFRYVQEFGSSPDDRFLLVEVDPEDVISVPYDGHEKIRVTYYKVVKEVERGSIMEGALWNSSGEKVASPVDTRKSDYWGNDDDDDDDWDDDWNYDDYYSYPY